MSRHRIVRSMNYSDEYDGYDDVYGHSVEDDYSMSPSDAAFMYDRDSRQPAQISAFLTTEEDILEEDESDNAVAGRKDSFVKPELSDVDEARLRSCRDEVQSVVGDSVSDSILDETILRCDFDVARTLDALLESPKPKSSTVHKPTNPETSISKTKVAAKHDGKDDFKFVSSHSDNSSNNLKKGNVSSQTKRMSTAEQIAASVALDCDVQSHCSNKIPIEVESKGKLLNGTLSSPTRASGFSSLKALKMKHKQPSAETSRKCTEFDESRKKLDIIVSPEVEVVEKNSCANILECASESGFCSSELKSTMVIPSAIDSEKVSSDSHSAVGSKPRSVCTPGRSSSLAALAKRCRNSSDRRPPSLLSADKTVQNPSAVVNISDQIISDSLPIEFEKMSIDQTKNSTKLANSNNLITENDANHSMKGTVLIDLMAALHSPSDEGRPVIDELDNVVTSVSNVHSQLQDVRANIFPNVFKVKNEFQTISCSPFGEIICKTFVFDCKEFVCTTVVSDSKVKPFSFDVMSPDDEIRKFRKNW